METWQLLTIFTVAEAAAIRCLSNPKADWFQAGGAAASANLLAFLVMEVAEPLIGVNWNATLPASAQIPLASGVVSWFCAFTLSNATELATLKWLWKLGLTRSLGITLSLSNAFTALYEIQQELFPA